MIGFAKHEDYAKIIRIWSICFGDSDDYIKAFLDNTFTDQNCLVFKVGNEIISMLFLLRGHIYSDGKLLSAYYIYAACTLPEQRKKGYMSKLIEQAIAYAGLTETDFLCLAPATESLFDYYAKFGFKKAFNRKNISLSRNMLINISDPQVSECSPVTDEIKSVRDGSLTSGDCFLWDKEMIAYAIKELRNAGGVAVFARKEQQLAGYAFFIENCNEVIVKEICSLNGYFGAVISVLLKAAAGDVFCFSLPVNFPLSSDNLTVQYNGMAFAVSSAAKLKIDKFKNAYIGLTLE